MPAKFGGDDFPSKLGERILKNHLFYIVFVFGWKWATPLVRLGLSRGNSGKIPERPRKRSESFSWNFPQEYGWDPPSPIIQGIWRLQSISRILPPPPPSTAGEAFFFQKWFRRGPLRASHGIPSSTGGISEKGLQPCLQILVGKKLSKLCLKSQVPNCKQAPMNLKLRTQKTRKMIRP